MLDVIESTQERPKQLGSWSCLKPLRPWNVELHKPVQSFDKPTGIIFTPKNPQ